MFESGNGLPRTVVRALAIIEAHFRDPLTLSALALALDRNRTHLARVFRRATGQTLHRHIADLRVREAAALIEQGQKIEAVMLRVGYRSKKNFYRQFRLATGVTPGVYRTRLRGASPVP